MPHKATCVAGVVIAATAFLTAQPARSADLTAKAGIGYDFLSQQYFLESIADTASDLLSANLALKTNYLDDLKGRLSLSYHPGETRDIELRSLFEQTAEQYRLRLSGDFRRKFGGTRLELNGEFDLRDSFEDSVGAGDSYRYAYGRIRVVTPLSHSIRLRTQLRADMVRFDSTSAFAYNYHRLGGKLGIEYVFADFSYFQLTPFFQLRQVTDSSQIDYVNLGLQSSALWFAGRNELDLYGRIETKEYDQIDDRDNHLRLEFEARNKTRLAERFSGRLEVDWELVDYTSADPINVDYRRLELALLGGYDANGLWIGFGPVLNLLDENGADGSLEEDYTESGARADLDYMAIGRLFISLENELGFRNMSDSSSLQTDYVYEKINLIGDLNLLASLSLNLLLSAEWQWHDLEDENSRIILLSSGLTWSF